MDNNRKIDINLVTTEEKQILLLLGKYSKYLYGNIFKELSISQSKGAEAILSLKNKGYIKNVGRSSFYELNISLE